MKVFSMNLKQSIQRALYKNNIQRNSHKTNCVNNSFGLQNNDGTENVMSQISDAAEYQK